MIKYRYEYRINKKGAECFRTEFLEEAREKLKELESKRPGVYTMQTRSVRMDKHGMLEVDWRGELSWSRWM